MGIPLLPARTPSGGHFSVYGWVANKNGELFLQNDIARQSPL